MVSVPLEAGHVYVPPIQRADTAGGIGPDDVLAEAHAAVAAMSPAELAQLILAATAGTDRADASAVRLRLAAIRLAAMAEGVAP